MPQLFRLLQVRRLINDYTRTPQRDLRFGSQFFRAALCIWPLQANCIHGSHAQHRGQAMRASSAPTTRGAGSCTAVRTSEPADDYR